MFRTAESRARFGKYVGRACFTEYREQVSEMFGWRRAQCLVSDEGEMVTLRELV